MQAGNWVTADEEGGDVLDVLLDIVGLFCAALFDPNATEALRKAAARAAYEGLGAIKAAPEAEDSDL